MRRCARARSKRAIWSVSRRSAAGSPGPPLLSVGDPLTLAPSGGEGGGEGECRINSHFRMVPDPVFLGLRVVMKFLKCTIPTLSLLALIASASSWASDKDQRVEQLIKELKNPDENVRYQAAEALREIGPEAKGAV